MTHSAACGSVCVLGAALLWGTTGTAAALVLLGRRAGHARGLPSRPVMGAIFGAGGVLLLPVLLLTGAPIVASWHNFAAVASLAAVPMFAGYVLFGRGLATVPASTATTLSLFEPAVAAVLAVLVLQEGLPPLGWGGMGILLASLIVLTAGPSRQHRDTAGITTPAPSRAIEPVP